MAKARKILLQVGVVLLFSTTLAFITNAARDNRLPLVMHFPPVYQCPSLEKPGLPMDLQTALNLHGKPGTLFIDSRKREVFQQGHIEGALPIPYSFVEPLPKKTLDDLRGYKTIVVYCSREDSDASKLMAGELAQAGIKGVFYLQGGFAEWVKAGGRHTGGAPEGHHKSAL